MTARRETLVVFSYVFLAILFFLLLLAVVLLFPAKHPGPRVILHSLQSSAVEPSAPLASVGTRLG